MSIEVENKKHERAFFVVVCGGFVRDAQIYVKPFPKDDESNFHDDEAGWTDFVGGAALGVYSADCMETAIEKASKECRIHFENLEAYEIVKE